MDDSMNGAGQRGERVAPWGDSATLFITAEALGEGTYFLLRPPPPENSMNPAARLSGKVTILADGCLGLGTGTPVVWPSGTTALPDGGGVLLSSGRELRIGEVLDTGGGFYEVGFTGRAAQCPSSSVAFIN